MTIQKLASAIAKREAKKSQVSIGNVREILRVIAELTNEAKTAAQCPMICLAEYAHKMKAKAQKKGRK